MHYEVLSRSLKARLMQSLGHPQRWLCMVKARDNTVTCVHPSCFLEKPTDFTLKNASWERAWRILALPFSVTRGSYCFVACCFPRL